MQAGSGMHAFKEESVLLLIKVELHNGEEPQRTLESTEPVGF